MSAHEPKVSSEDIGKYLSRQEAERFWQLRSLGESLGASKMTPLQVQEHDMLLVKAMRLKKVAIALVYLRETERGFEVEVSRALMDANQLIYINNTRSPFNGGWKSVVVGLSS